MKTIYLAVSYDNCDRDLEIYEAYKTEKEADKRVEELKKKHPAYRVFYYSLEVKFIMK